ncbi:Hydrophobin-B [Grifola frondosa]|uniref:Hydrophobin n=1 Tax=Grifola frondosa TaxID=5627 RepID=A0A1C7ML69_GRIFR|nr:Hydrophobin-B [Grifola frondosa]
MFARIAAVSFLALAAATSANSQCNTGPIQCCQSVQQANSAAGTALLSMLGVVLNDPTVLIGGQCSPISAVGVGSGSECNAHPVCCTNNNVGGVLSVGCVPVQL